MPFHFRKAEEPRRFPLNAEGAGFDAPPSMEEELEIPEGAEPLDGDVD